MPTGMGHKITFSFKTYQARSLEEKTWETVETLIYKLYSFSVVFKKFHKNVKKSLSLINKLEYSPSH